MPLSRNTQCSGINTLPTRILIMPKPLKNWNIPLRASWAIEPAIAPLGFDWKIGIALITSFAAREVFVGTMATLYSVGDDSDAIYIKDKMRIARHPDGRPVYTLASGLSLLIFYVFAMQCMSTLAIVKRETSSWKIPLVQFLYMSALAYLSAFAVFQLFS